VLAAATARTTSAGTPSRATYELDDRVRSTARARIADLLARFPLYPALDLVDGAPS
jgi:glycine hydroxymethyltransferase